MMRMIQSMEAVGPLVKIIAAIRVGIGVPLRLCANLSISRFFGLFSGIFFSMTRSRP